MLNSQILLDGSKEAEKIFLDLKKQIAKLKFKPTLAVILVGHDPASKIYVAIKEKRAKEIGVNFFKYHLSETVSEQKIVNLIKKLNNDKKITGLMVQLPLPKKFKTNKIISLIDKKKDVDGLHPPLLYKERVGERSPEIISPTIQSILHLIKLSKQKLINKKAVILCHSQEFAESLKKELAKEKIKVFIKSKSQFTNYQLPITNYRIVIIALGKKYFLKPAMLKKDAIIIDVGINRVGKKIFGDVDPSCLIKTKYISPVPGGVGPLTVAYLFKNLIKLSKVK